MGGQNHQNRPYFGPRANNEVSEGKFENLEKKHAITGAFLSPDTKSYAVLESSGQPDSDNLGPTAHRVNLVCQLAAFATQVKISPLDFLGTFIFLGSCPDLDFLVINPISPIPKYVGEMVFALNKSILGGFGVDFFKFRPFLLFLTFNHHNFG